MKKLSAIILALLITASVATGCAKDEPVKDTDISVESEAPSEETEAEVEEAEPEEEVTEESTEPEEDVTEESEEEVTEEDATEPEPEVETEESETEEKAPATEEKPVEDPVEEQPEETPETEEAKPEKENKPLTEVKPEKEDKPVEVKPEEVKPEEAPVEEEKAPAASSSNVSSMSSAEIIDAINEIKAPEFMYGTIPVDTADPDALKMFTGLDNKDLIKEVAVCESMMGSQAYSLVVVKVADASNTKSVAENMKDGIDQRKWICVEADDIKVSGKGDVVMLIMIDSEYRDSISVEDVTAAFKTVCGGALDFEI